MNVVNKQSRGDEKASYSSAWVGGRAKNSSPWKADQKITKCDKEILKIGTGALQRLTHRKLTTASDFELEA